MKIMELSTKEYEVLVKKGLVEEDKKIEKIDIKWDKDYYVLDENNDKRYLNERDKIEMNKINEIIDYINNKD